MLVNVEVAAAVELVGGDAAADGETIRIGVDGLGAVVGKLPAPLELAGVPLELDELIVEFCPAGSQCVAGVTPPPAGD